MSARRMFVLLAVGIVALLAFAACSPSEEEAGSTEQEADDASDQEPAEEEPAEEEAPEDDGEDAAEGEGDGPDPAAGEVPEPLEDADEVVDVAFAQSVPAASFAALYVARELNFFGYNGVNLTDETLDSNVTAVNALLGGDLDLTAASATDVLSAQDADLLGIQNFYMATLQVCVSEEWAEAQGVSASSSVPERLAALEGASIGTSAPGALSDRLPRFLLSAYGDLDPNTDVELVQIGGPPALASALDDDLIQAFVFSPPACALTESGFPLIQPNEVAELENFLVGTLYGRRSWIEENPEVAQGVATAISMGNNFILEYPDAAFEILRGQFSDVDPEALSAGFYDTILPQIRPDGEMDEEMWTVTSEVMRDSGGLDELPDTSEGVLWTNDYIEDPSLPY